MHQQQATSPRRQPSAPPRLAPFLTTGPGRHLLLLLALSAALLAALVATDAQPLRWLAGWAERYPGLHFDAVGSTAFVLLLGLAGLAIEQTRRQRQEAVRRLETERTLAERMAAVEAASEGIAILDAAGKYAWVNGAHAHLYDFPSPEAMVGVSWRGLYGEEELAYLEENVLPILKRKGHWRGELVGRRQDGSTFDQEVALTRLPGGGMVSVVRDVTLERSLRHQALHDPLTELPNRLLLQDRLTKAAQVAERRSEGAMAILYVDVDDFKGVNDRHGHGVGDRVLVWVAEVLRGAVRDGDTAARVGGDEFVVLLPEVADEDAARAVAGRILAYARLTGPPAGVRSAVRLTVGVETAPAGRPVDTDGLVNRANLAMHRGKGEGGDRVEGRAEASKPDGAARTAGVGA